MADSANNVAAAETEKTSKNSTSSEPDGAVTNNDTKAEEASPPVPEMRAVLLNSFGGLKTIKIVKKPEPTVTEGEVLIRVKACGLNFQDLMMRQGVIDSPPKTPVILGVECAGEVIAVGEGVEGFKEGDAVAALSEARAWAEVVSVPAAFVYHLPTSLSFSDAAAITLPYTVAHVLLFQLGNLASGKTILLTSAGGAVGQAVAQLSKTVPEVTLIGLASKGKHEAIKDSVDHLLERSGDYLSEIRKITPEGVDIVLDCLCGEDCNKGYSLLKPMGKYILYGTSSVVTGETKSIFSVAKSWWQVDKVSPIKLFDENKSITGFNLRHLLYQQKGSDFVRETVEKVYKLWQDGKITPIIDSTWAIEDVAEAMQKIHDRRNVGKIILDPSLEPKPKPIPPPKGKAAKNNSEEKDDKPKKEEEKKEETKEEEPSKDEKKEEVEGTEPKPAES